jgi:hypothetical protein
VTECGSIMGIDADAVIGMLNNGRLRSRGGLVRPAVVRDDP